MNTGRYFLLILLTLSACQSIDLSEVGEEGGSSPTIEQLPIGVGEGTAQRPWTVTQLLGNEIQNGLEGWVIGYAVGAAYQTLSSVEFSSGTSYDPNVFLSADSLCMTTARCVPVELTSNKMRQACAIPYNRSHFRQCLMVHGKVSGYFRMVGIRSVDAAQWCDGFDIQLIDPQPEEWQDTTNIRK